MKTFLRVLGVAVAGVILLVGGVLLLRVAQFQLPITLAQVIVVISASR